MIKITGDKNVLHFVCSGRITHEDYVKSVIPTVERVASRERSLRALCDLREMQSIELKAIIDDYKLGLRHVHDFKAMVTVGNQWWIQPLMAIARPFFKMKLMHFKSRDYDKAWEWIQNN